MAILDLSQDERRLVARILDREYQDLRAEIYKTDSPEMKEELERDKLVLAGVLEKLGIKKPDIDIKKRVA